MTGSRPIDEHLQPEDIAAYLGGPPGRRRSRVEGHLARCDDCRLEVVRVHNLVDEHRRARRRPHRAVVSVAAAAALAVVVVPQLLERDETGRRFRVGGESGQQIEVVGPADGGLLAADSIGFVWRAVATDAQYVLQITDAEGDLVLTESTADTTLVLSARMLRAGQTYVWFLDALLPNGESATSRLQRLRVP